MNYTLTQTTTTDYYDVADTGYWFAISGRTRGLITGIERNWEWSVFRAAPALLEPSTRVVAGESIDRDTALAQVENAIQAHSARQIPPRRPGSNPDLPGSGVHG